MTVELGQLGNGDAGLGPAMAKGASVTDPERGQARHAQFARLAIAIAFITFFGFALPDGYDTAAEDLAVNHYYRGLGFFIAALIVILSGIANGFGRARVPAAFVVLVVMYAFYALTGPMLYGRWNDIGVIEYVIAEWLTMLLLVHQTMPRTKADDPPSTKAISMVKLLVVMTFLIVLAYYFIFPQSVLTIGSRFQLGGLAIHPNRLGFISSVGILVFGIRARRPRDYIFALVCVVVVLLSGSRVGLVMGSTAICIWAMSRTGPVIRSALAAVVLGIGTWVVFTVFTEGPAAVIDPGGHEWYSLNGRTDVWGAALQMFSMSPGIGWGFFLGPKHIGDILNQAWWHASNAQNDLFGAMVCGGYVGIFLFLGFLAVFARTAFRVREKRDRHLALGVFVLYLMSSSFEPFFVHSIGVSTVIMLFMIAQMSEWSRRVPAQSPAS
jgi:O-antigen ligase